MEKDNLLIICPNSYKMRLLDKLSKDDTLYDIKFMTKSEFFENYFFSYDEKAIIFIMKKYNYKLDVVKTLFKYLYVIDENKNYENEKLDLLVKIKNDLISNNLLSYNNNFREYIKRRNILVKNYYDLDLYEEKILNYKEEFQGATIDCDVYEYQTMEDEVNYTCLKIIDLINNGVDINKICLTNITDDYLYTIKKMFSYYNIPINIDMKNSIYSTKVVKDYLDTGKVYMDDSSKLRINKYLVNIINSLVDIKDDSKEYRSILLDKLKTTYIKDERRVNAINIKDLYSDYFMDDEYVFVLGFNQDYLPKTMKDVFYITDDLKDELDLYKTPYKNNRLKNVVINILANIKNLYLSYKKSSPFATYYKSPIITDLSLNVIKRDDDSFSKSNIYNKIRLVELLDLYNLYKEERPNLKKLYTNYDIPYKTYSNEFTKIDNDKYLENIPYPLKLSYTSMNTYNECRFKYYIKYVLKLDEFTDTFQAFIGSMYHKILSLYRYENFDFEKEYNKYLEKRDLSLKEKLLLVRIKKELKELLNSIKSQDLITGYNDFYVEKKIDIELDKKVSTIFTGTIDKIMYYKKIDDMYFSIIDYKTGNIDTAIEAMKYGLHMQLPIYLYLINYSKVFKSPIFTGIYYQNILFNYPNFDYKKDLEKLKNDRIKLQGYTTDDTFILERFDPTYEDSSYIKSMKYDDKKGFSRYTKLIGNDTLYDLINYTRHFIDKTADDIIDGDFSINPKIYDKKNVSCEFCKFKDLCYMSDKDLVYLEKQKDLSFLGGDNNA